MKNKRIHLLGNVNVDIVMRTILAWPHPGTEVILPEHEVRVGGAAGNTAMALAALDIDTELHAEVGNDLFGDMLVRALSQRNYSIGQRPGDTAYSVALGHDDGQRTFFTYPGHLDRQEASGITRVIGSTQGETLLLCGYFLMKALHGGLAKRFLEHAKKHDFTILLDPGHPANGWIEQVRAELDSLIPFIDMVLPNEDELLGWSQTDDVAAGLSWLNEAGCGCVCKMGANGTRWQYEGVLGACDAPAVEVIDTEPGAKSVRLLANTESMVARQVVVAAGAWSQQFGLPVTPQRGEAIVLSGFQPISPINAGDGYILPYGNSTYVGATHRRGWASGVDLQGLSWLTNYVETWFPELISLPSKNLAWGFRPMADTPIIGNRDKRVLIATGHGKRGVLWAPATANIILNILGITI